MDLQELIDIERISRLKYRYLRCLDQKRWDDLEGCFTEDATARYGGGAVELNGRAEIMTFLREAMSSTAMLTSHRCHHPEIDFDGRGGAAGVWALEDVVVHQDVGVTIQGAAFYEDRYRLEAEGWRISSTGYTRTYEEVFPRASIAGLQVTADWWATGGRSTLPVPRPPR